MLIVNQHQQLRAFIHIPMSGTLSIKGRLQLRNQCLHRRNDHLQQIYEHLHVCNDHLQQIYDHLHFRNEHLHCMDEYLHV